ncbi:MAG: 2-polyprenylphenol 6-hydroxylase [Pseudohongiellaceae bacterium]
MSPIIRLNKLLSVVARYRLTRFLAGWGISPWRGVRWAVLYCLLLPYRLRWLFSGVRHDSRHRCLRLALEEMGPIYIKFGQLLSTRRDFLDVELADELQSLQDDVPPFTSPAVTEIIEQALGAPAHKLFAKLEDEPFASASVAQVYKAELPDGSKVVVKVLRPGIEKIVAADIELLKWLAELLHDHTSIGKRLRPMEVVADYEKIIFDELNLCTEGANTAQLGRNFPDSDILYVPKVYWDYTRRNILVLERIYGIAVTDIKSLEAHNINLKALAETGVRIFFTQVLEHNFFHADMHPGNIFVSRDKQDKPQYIAVDCAIIGSLSQGDQEYLALNLLAIFKQDYRRVAELHIACGWVPPHTRAAELESAIRSVCEPIFEKPLGEISFGQILVQLFRTAGRFDMEVQPSLVLLQKTLLNIEGLGRQLYPQLDLWENALPYLEDWNRKRLSPLSLLARLAENIPEWLDKLPELPQALAGGGGHSRMLEQRVAELSAELAARREQTRRTQRRSRIGGVLLLTLSLGSFYAPVASWLNQISTALAPTTTLASVITLTLALGGLYFLFFRR